MRIYDADDGVNAALLNTMMDYDAIVDGSLAANSGTKYTTLQAAVAAGHRYIYVKAGSYNSATTINNSNVTVVGESMAAYTPSTEAFTSTYGPVFTRVITITGSNVVLENLSVKTSSGNGIIVYGDDVTLANCQVCGTPSTALTSGMYAKNTRVWGGNYSDNTYTGFNVGTGCSAIIVGAMFSRNNIGIYNGGNAHIVSVTVQDNAEYGIQQGDAGDVTTVVGSTVNRNGSDYTDDILYGVLEAGNTITPE